MSRKTRKLMWSVPLIAAVAVIGVLVAYVMLAPGEVQAHPTLPPDPVTRVDVTTPTAAEGGRTSLRVTWNAPEADNAPTMYRVDMSTDTHIWHNVIGGENSTEMLTESMATSNCTIDDSRNRCYTVEKLMPSKTYHFRVFAMNYFGTSPISVNKTIGTGKTRAVEPPDRVTDLNATTYYLDKIQLDWREPVGDGGADLLWYCIGIAASPTGAFADLANDTTAACLDATEATPAAKEADEEGVYISPVMIGEFLDGANTAAESETIVVPATEDGNPVIQYEHLGLGTPGIITLRYRLYAVTDEDGDPDTVGDRRISRAASNTATGRTVAPADTAIPKAEKPDAPRNLRAVAFSTARDSNNDLPTTSGQGLYFYWNVPENYPAGTPADPRNWEIVVERVVPDPESETGGTIWQPVDDEGSPPAVLDYGVPQFAVDFGGGTINTPPIIIGDTPSDGQFQVRYVNPGADTTSTDAADDDVDGVPAPITLDLPLDAGDYRNAGGPDDTSTLPIILRSSGNDTHTDLDDNQEGLRFTRNQDNPKTSIDLRWTSNANMNTIEAEKRPTGYVIDRSDDAGMTWKPIFRATQPTELGTSVSHTDYQDVAPGKRYIYRVFPVVILPTVDSYGLPALIDASSEEADVPEGVEGLEVTAKGQTALTLTWDKLEKEDDGGHPVRGYLVQYAAGDLNNDEDLSSTPSWTNVGVLANTSDSGYVPYTVDKNTLTYNYPPTGSTDTLVAGSARWFRVIAITNENDGDDATGGNQVNIETAALAIGTPSPSEGLPTDEDKERADPARGETESLPRPSADKDPVPPEKPVDLTAEAAFDSNALSDGGRGVFLTWNEVKTSATKTASYKVERMRMDTGVDALDNTTWVFIGRATGDTSFTDREPLRRDTEMRLYRVGSEATGIAGTVFVPDPGVMYALRHPDMHMPSMPQMVTATADSDTVITVSWATPADNGRSEITGWIVEKAYGGSFLDAERTNDDAFTDAQTWWDGLDCPNMVAAVMDDRTADMDNPFCAMYADLDTAEEEEVERVFAARYDIIDDAAKTNVTYSDLTPETKYMYRVAAVNAVGLGAWSYKVMATTLATDTMLGNAIDLMMVETDTDPGTIELTWTASANANVHRVAGARKNDDGSFDLTDQVWELVEGDMQNSFTVDGDALNLSPGTYLFAVIAGQRDDSGQTTWSSTWAILDDVDYLQ